MLTGGMGVGRRVALVTEPVGRMVLAVLSWLARGWERMG